jgi:hypothetical protein
MSELEEVVRFHVRAGEWIKLKMYEEKQIAICMYHPDTEERKKIIVQAFRASEEDFPNHHFNIQSFVVTERKFKKKDGKIAKWYFKELCRSLKNGILISASLMKNSGRSAK